MKRRVLAAAGLSMIMAGTAVAGSPGTGSPGAGAPVEVGAGHAVLLTLGHSARQVIVGDPSVADVTVESPTRVLVFGKRAGSTSLTVIDGGHRAVLDTAVVVHPAAAGGVTVTYGAGKDVKPGGQTAVFACAATCVRTIEKAADGKQPQSQPPTSK